MTTPSEEYWSIPLTRVALPERGVEAVARVLRSGWLSSGAQVEKFEADFAALAGCAHGVACASGTAALELAFAALDLSAGDEVIVPALNFVAVANAIRRTGARPVFVDIVGDDDLTVDPDAIAQAITPRTRAVVPMHYAGYPCQSAVTTAAHDRGLALVEDAAHAPGAVGLPGPVGSWGAFGCFSFYANKNIPLGEGGMLVTRDPALAERARRMRANGVTRTSSDRRRGRGWTYDVPEQGLSVRMDEPRAALGSVLLESLEQDRAGRAAAVARYRERLDGLAGLHVPFGDRPSDERAAHHLMVVVLDPGIDRSEVVAQMTGQRIETSVHYPPIHTLTAYADPTARLPRTDALAGRLLTLPLFGCMTPDEVDHVCTAITSAIESARVGQGSATR